jgi:hypothetical protein
MRRALQGGRGHPIPWRSRVILSRQFLPPRLPFAAEKRSVATSQFQEDGDPEKPGEQSWSSLCDPCRFYRLRVLFSRLLKSPWPKSYLTFMHPKIYGLIGNWLSGESHLVRRSTSWISCTYDDLDDRTRHATTTPRELNWHSLPASGFTCL